MAEKISGIYKIINTITGDFYIGSSKNVKQRWRSHKSLSKWNEYPNNKMYQDMKRYGMDYFVFEILEEVEANKLKEIEQQFIEKLKPTYNNYNANGFNVERRKKSQNEYQKLDKYKESHKKASKEYYYRNIEKQKQYNNQQCLYNGKTINLAALKMRFQRAGIAHPTIEAKKYLML